MKMKIIFLLISILPIPGWACTGVLNGSDLTITTLPQTVLLSAGNYSAGTVLYDSGQIRAPSSVILNCRGEVYANVVWRDSMVGGLTSDKTYSTSTPGVGIKVKLWINASGTHEGSGGNLNPDTSVHYVGDTKFYLGTTSLFTPYVSSNYIPLYQLQLIATGGAIASNSAISFNGPLAELYTSDNDANLTLSRLFISGTTRLQLVPMGCNTDTASLNFDMGSINVTEFNTKTKVGSADKTLTLTCEPGTNVNLRITATGATGDNQNNSVMALTAGEKSASGVGVQLSLNSETLPLNTDLTLYTSNRTKMSSPSTTNTYTVFTDLGNPGGASGTNTLTFTANYYKTLATVLAGDANASGTLTFTYN